MPIIIPNTFGTIATGQNGNVTPGLPTSPIWLPYDIHVCVVGAADNVTVTFPAGWTKKIELNNGTTERLTVAWRRAVAGDAAPLVTHAAGGDIAAQIMGYRGAVTNNDPFDAVASQANASSTTITAPTITPLNANDMILFIGTTINGSNLATISGYSGTNPTFTERIDGGASGGSNNVAIFLADGSKNDFTATGSRTATGSQAGVNIGALLSMLAAGVVLLRRSRPFPFRPGSPAR